MMKNVVHTQAVAIAIAEEACGMEFPKRLLKFTRAVRSLATGRGEVVQEATGAENASAVCRALGASRALPVEALADRRR